MGTVNVDLFTIRNPRPNGAPIYGQASVSALPTAEFNFDRGFDVALGIDLEAQVGAEMRDVLYAALGGGVRGSLGIQAKVGFPLDLFSSTGGGFAARFRGQAEAAGYLRADVGLNTATFTGLLRDAVPGPVTDLITIFLDHVDVSAGVWAHAGVAAQVDAQAYCTGTLWPPKSAGFSFVMKYAIGYYYGYGLSYVTNFRINDPAGMLDRLSARIAAQAVSAATDYLGGLPAGSAEQKAAAAALPYLQLLLPAFTRCLFAIGTQLADGTATASHKQDATRSVVASFLAEAQKLAVNTVIEVAAQSLADAFQGNALLDTLANLTPEQKAHAFFDLESLRGDLWALTRRGMSAQEVLDGITGCLVPLQDLLDLGVFLGARADLEQALGLTWAGAALAHRVAGWAAEPSSIIADLAADETLLPPLPDGLVATWLAKKIPGKGSGTGLRVSDLVTVLIDAAPLTHAPLSAELTALLAWVRDVLGVPPQDLLTVLLHAQVQGGDDGAAQIVSRLAERASAAVRDTVLPNLLDKVAAAASPELREVINGVAIPALIGLPAVVLPALASLGTSQQARRVRETASVLLLQTFTDLVLHSVDILLDVGLSQGAPLVSGIASEIAMQGAEHPLYGVLISTAAAAVTGVDVLPADAADLLNLSGRAMTLWNDHQRAATLDLLRAVMRLRLGDPPMRDQTLATYSTTNDAPVRPDLTFALKQVGDGMWLLIRELLPDALAVGPRHLQHQVQASGAAVVELWAMGINEVEKFLATWPATLQKWEETLNELALDIARWAGEVADWILALPGKLLGIEQQFFEALDAEADRLLDVITAGYPAPIPFLAKAAFHASAAPLRWQLEAPLAVLAAVDELLRQAAAEQLATGQINAASLRDNMRQRILRSRAVGIYIPVVIDGGVLGRLDFGTVSLDGSWMRQAVADVILGHPEVTTTLDAVADKLGLQRAAQSAQLTAARGKAEALSHAQAAAQVTATATGRPPSIVIHNPVDGAAMPDRFPINLYVQDVNRTFIEPPLGAPQRIAVRLNGQRIATNPAWWTDESGMQFLSMTVMASQEKVFPVLAFPQGQFYVEGQPATPGILHTFEARTWRDPIVVGRPGLNTLEVVVTDGAGHLATATRHFYLGPTALSSVLFADRQAGSVLAFRPNGRSTPAFFREYANLGSNVTQAVALTLGPARQPGLLLIGDSVVTVFNLLTGDRAYQDAGILTGTLLTAGYFDNPDRCDLVSITAGTGELRRYTALDDEGALDATGPLGGAPTDAVAATTVQPTAGALDMVAVLSPGKLTLLTVEGVDLEISAKITLGPQPWTNIVAGRFTTSGAPGLLFYAADSGAWQIGTFDGPILNMVYGGAAGMAVAPLPTGITDLVPGRFGGTGLTDLFLWKGGHMEGSIVTTSGSDGFTIITPRWTDWDMSDYGPPVAVRLDPAP